MYDLAAIAIALGCFALIFALLYVLERVWHPATSFGSHVLQYASTSAFCAGVGVSVM